MWFVYILLASCAQDIVKIQLDLLELNDYCMHILKKKNSKWENYKVELGDIQWLCKINSQKYFIAKQELIESLSQDLKTISESCI